MAVISISTNATPSGLAIGWSVTEGADAWAWSAYGHYGTCTGVEPTKAAAQRAATEASVALDREPQ